MIVEERDPPQEVMDELLISFKKEGINPKGVTRDQIRQQLKKLKRMKLYKYVPVIFYTLTETEPFRISQDTEFRLLEMFSGISNQWSEIRQQVPHYFEGKVWYSKSFLSYSYLVYKMMELLVSMDLIKETDFKNHLPIMKSVEKLNNSDKYWKVICDKYGWKFYKSE